MQQSSRYLISGLQNPKPRQLLNVGHRELVREGSLA